MTRRWLGIGFVALLAAGCGRKGALTLPKEEPAAPPPPAVTDEAEPAS